MIKASLLNHKHQKNLNYVLLKSGSQQNIGACRISLADKTWKPQLNKILYEWSLQAVLALLFVKYDFPPTS